MIALSMPSALRLLCACGGVFCYVEQANLCSSRPLAAAVQTSPPGESAGLGQNVEGVVNEI